jgi:hypothetical protein
MGCAVWYKKKILKNQISKMKLFLLGFVAGQSGFVAGQSGFVAGQSGFVAGQSGFVAGQSDLSLFCSDKIQNGLAIPSDGSQQKLLVTCSSLPLGILPKKTKMTSTLIIQPENNSQLDAQVENIVRVSTRNMVSGFFSDANTLYYTSPQTVENGNIQGISIL